MTAARQMLRRFAVSCCVVAALILTGRIPSLTAQVAVLTVWAATGLFVAVTYRQAVLDADLRRVPARTVERLVSRQARQDSDDA